MSLIDSFRDFRVLSIVATLLIAVPLFAQQGNTPPAQPSGNTSAQQGVSAQGQQPSGTTQAQPGGIAPSTLVVAPAAKFPNPTGEDYSKGTSYFPNPLAPYSVRNVPQAGFNNAPKLESMIHDGKIMLSMDDAIALALADNLDIAIARYNLPIADTDLLRTKAGSAIFGVGTGLLSNTPGGGGIAATALASGTGAGGTAVGSGGIGAGANGVVGSTFGAGPALETWDPVITGTLQEQHQTLPQASSFLNAGQAATSSNTFIGNFTYTQGFSYGSVLSVGYNNQRATSSNPFSSLSPQISSNFTMTIRQHLLQGWGWAVNRRWLTIARDNRRNTEESFRDQVSHTVSQVQDIYWDLVSAYEDLKVKERSLALDEKTLADNKKQVEIGTMAPISVVQAESAVATDQQNLHAARSTLQLQQLYMKNAMSRSMVAGSELMKADIIPTDTVIVPEQDTPIDVDALIQSALENSPAFIQQKLNLKQRLLSIQGANNVLRPSVDLIGFYGAASLAGAQNLAGTCNPNGTPFQRNTGLCNPAGSFPATGFGDAFGNLFNSSASDKGVAVQINIPLRNRVAQAEQVRSQLEYRQAELSFKQAQNNFAISIRNEVFNLEQNRATIIAAREAQTFAEQNLEAEQKKYALGASTSFNVMNLQAQLAIAQEHTIAAEIAYAKERVTLDLNTAQTLEHNNIILDEAVTGQIKTQPRVPGIGPNTFIEQTGSPAANPPAPVLTPRPDQPKTRPPQQQPPR
jgi:outer membrane protein TolC